MQSLLVQQVVLPQLADCVLQAQQLLQVSSVALLQNFDLLLQLGHDGLQLLLTQAVLMVAAQVREGNRLLKDVIQRKNRRNESEMCSLVVIEMF